MKNLRYIVIILFCIFCAALSFAAETNNQQKRILLHEIRQTTMISDDQFRDVFLRYLYDALGKDESDIVLSKFNISHNRPVPEGKLSFQPIKNNGALNGFVKMTVIVNVNGTHENEVRLSGWIDEFSPVVCASRNLKKGETIKEEDIYLSKKNVSRLPTNVLTNKNKAIGLLAKNSIKRGTSLKEWMVEKNPIVRKGNLVTILAQRGSIRITVPGIILEKGYAGELIRVKNTMSSKEIYARVQNQSIVTVDF